MSAKLNGPICVCGTRPSTACPNYRPDRSGLCRHRDILGYWVPHAIELLAPEPAAHSRIGREIGRCEEQVSRIEHRAIAKLRENPDLLATHPELAQRIGMLTKKFSTETAPILGSDVGCEHAIAQAVVRKDHPMKNFPALLCELGAAVGSHELPAQSVEALRVIAASGDIARFESELSKSMAAAPPRTIELDANERHRLNPYLPRMMRAAGLTAANIAEHGPRQFAVQPDLEQLVADSTARGEKLGTGPTGVDTGL